MKIMHPTLAVDSASIPGPQPSPLKRLPSLDSLRGFDAAARTLSFTLAGQALNLTQSAISRQVQSLEEALGLRLFERFNRRLALTANGSAFHLR